MIYEHIGIFPNAISDSMCDKLIGIFDKSHSSGFSKNRQDFEKINKTHKDDSFIFMINDELFSSLNVDTYSISSDFKFELLGNAYELYRKKYSILNEIAFHTLYEIKVQRTEVGQGYHMWHTEVGNRSSSTRIMAYTVYLNTVDEGGETEFLYQSKRIKPEKGTVVIWPATYTHVHRGNPPLSNTKYIATGWIEF